MSKCLAYTPLVAKGLAAVRCQMKAYTPAADATPDTYERNPEVVLLLAALEKQGWLYPYEFHIQAYPRAALHATARGYPPVRGCLSP